MKHVLRLLVVLLALLTMTGCATVHLTYRVTPDGAVEKEMIVALDKQVLGLLGAGGEDPLKGLQDEVKQQAPDARLSRYEENGRVGFKAIAPVRGTDKLDDKTWKGQFAVRDGWFWRDYSLDLDADFAFDQKDMAQAAMFLNQMDLKVSVELPTAIGQHNGQTDSTGKKVTWSLVPNHKDHLTMQARQYHTGRIALALLLLLLLAGAGVCLARRQRRSEPLPPADSDVA